MRKFSTRSSSYSRYSRRSTTCKAAAVGRATQPPAARGKPLRLLIALALCQHCCRLPGMEGLVLSTLSLLTAALAAAAAADFSQPEPGVSGASLAHAVGGLCRRRAHALGGEAVLHSGAFPVSVGPWRNRLELTTDSLAHRDGVARVVVGKGPAAARSGDEMRNSQLVVRNTAVGVES